MKTEKEAKELWCPFARSYMTIQDDQSRWHVAPKNRQMEYADCRCIASKCMAWRGKIAWRGATDKILYDGPPVHQESEEIAIGYCGLAGKP